MVRTSIRKFLEYFQFINPSALNFYAIAATDARLTMKTVKESIEEAKGALVLYDKLVERVIPWKEFNETLVGLDKFREDYTVESALLITEIKTNMADGISAYFSASEHIYEWTGIAASHLELYIKLFKDHNARRASAQKDLLLNVLESGLKKMTAAQEELGKSSESFSSVFGRLSTLRKRFEDEFDEQSGFFQAKMELIRKGSHFLGSSIFGISGFFLGAEIGDQRYIRKLKRELEIVKQFYYHLHIKIEHAFNNIHETKKVLKQEIQHITELKIQIQQTEMFVNLDQVPDLRDTVIDSANDLIVKCEEYRKRHIEKIES